MRVEFLYWEECPSHADALARLRHVIAEEGLAVDLDVIRVDSQEDADRHNFPGSPTIRIEGKDLQPEGVQGLAMLTCRTYMTETGRLSPLPTVTMISRALRARGTPADTITTKEARHDAGSS